ncbi:hypothetical protein ACHAXA_008266 [Cyclostephanos tholiformis]|uniref:UBA domain-containing protein n=1 Tax=Cyclostephanos tholiformis TaxID=382380 RepID=A0ABD3R471_9STRA
MMEYLISRAAAELSIRAEVEMTLKSILHDVEQAHYLESSLSSLNELRIREERLESLQVRYDDMRETTRLEELRENERLGNILLGELIDLSARILEKDGKNRELEARLRLLEDNEVRRRSAANARDRTGIDDVGGTTDIGEVMADENDNIPVIRLEAVDDEIDIPDRVAKVDDASSSELTNAAAVTNTAASPTTYDDGPNAFVPHVLDEITLMGIFAYLDPIEIMNFAQTNKALLSKVNVMFGMGGGDEGGGGSVERGESERDSDDVRQQRPQRGGSYSEGDSTDDAVVVDDDHRDHGGDGEHREEKTRQLESMGFDPERARLALDAAGGDVVRAAELLLLDDDLPPSHDAPPDSIAHRGGMTTRSHSPSPMATMRTSSSSSSSEGGTKITPSSTTAVNSSPKLFGMPSPSHHRRQGSSTSVATAGSGGNPFSQVSSWFGGVGIDSSSIPSATIAGNIPPSTNISSSKLHKCEADAIRWRHEKEDAEANLASVEAVKEFLVTRVRDTERVVQAQKEEMREVQKRSLEDQEVIVFLDERVKALEKAVDDMKSKEAKIKKESLDIVNKNEKKSRVLSDMLRFELVRHYPKAATTLLLLAAAIRGGEAMRRNRRTKANL